MKIGEETPGKQENIRIGTVVAHLADLAPGFLHIFLRFHFIPFYLWFPSQSLNLVYYLFSFKYLFSF